jgi:hypothetical protein
LRKARLVENYGRTEPCLCRVCQARCDPLDSVFGKLWFRCRECGFVQAELSDTLYADLSSGEGLAAGTGAGGGGYREYFLSRLLHDELELSSILLYGTGNTPTFARLMDEGLDVYGCDLSRDLIRLRNEAFGDSRFFHPDELREDAHFDLIVAVEVFEHFPAPLRSLRLLRDHCTMQGLISGTTDFYDGSRISDHAYLKPRLHVAYWSETSLRTAGGLIGLPFLQLFELVSPGSVKPDEKYGMLWPRKRVFFMYSSQEYDEYFSELRKRDPILPIDRP